MSTGPHGGADLNNSPSSLPAPLRAISDAATSEPRLLEGRDSRSQELLRVMRIGREFVRGFRALHFVGPCITFFGSSRFGEGHDYYQPSVDLARRVGELGFNIMTGGGPGLMEAANRGGREAGVLSVGATIDLGKEPPNRFVDMRVPFHYFFARKVILVKYSYGFVLLPGGIGTLDELFEAATLIQTDRLHDFPLVLYRHDYWDGLIQWLRETPLAKGAFSPEDLDRLHVTDDPDEVVDYLRPLAHQLKMGS